MAAFNRPKEATYEIHESVKVDTLDNEDHTFCGIMFPIKCKDMLPVDHISIRSVAVRGQLGPMTVWVSKEEKQRGRNNATTDFKLTKSHWTKVYQKRHDPSPLEYENLELDKPIILKPGQVRAVYIHSTLPGDQAIVYDNAAFYYPRFGRHVHGHNQNNSRQCRYEDAMIQIHTGRAHVSTSIFGVQPIWGWGNAWRDHREFVGQIHYGAVYKLFNPETRNLFGPRFRESLFNLKLCQTRWESPISKLPDECILYILNMCRWDWFQDNQETMQVHSRELKEKQKREREQQIMAQAQAREEESAREMAVCSSGKESTGNDATSETEYEDAMENPEESDANLGGDDGVDDNDIEAEVNDDDDDDDDDEWMESDEDLEDSDDEWEAANGYRADTNVFRFVDPELEEEQEEDNEEEDEESATHQAWIRRQFQRIHVLRALARQQDADEDVVDVHFVLP